MRSLRRVLIGGIFQLYPSLVHITAVKVEYKTPTNRVNKGVATSWIATKVPNEENPPKVPMFIRKSQFRLVSRKYFV